MINVIDTPATPVSNLPIQTSRWVAAHAPVIFRLQRQDFTVLSVYDNGQGKALVYLSTTPPTVTVGEYIYINSGSYVGVFKVLAEYYTAITLDTPYIGSASGGFMNIDASRPNYEVEFKLLKVVNNTWVEHDVMRVTPNIDGTIDVDVSSKLQALCSYADNYDYTTLNKLDSRLGGKFNFQLRERYTGYTPSYSTFTNANTYYYVNANKDVLVKYGANMGEFVTFPAMVAPYARFLAPDLELSYWPGMPFSLSFIWSEKAAAYDITRESDQLDVNGGLISHGSILLDGAQHTTVNRMLIPTPGAGCEKMLVWLDIDITIQNDDYVAADFMDTGYTVEVVRGAETPQNPIE